MNLSSVKAGREKWTHNGGVSEYRSPEGCLGEWGVYCERDMVDRVFRYRHTVWLPRRSVFCWPYNSRGVFWTTAVDVQRCGGHGTVEPDALGIGAFLVGVYLHDTLLYEVGRRGEHNS